MRKLNREQLCVHRMKHPHMCPRLIRPRIPKFRLHGVGNITGIRLKKHEIGIGLIAHCNSPPSRDAPAKGGGIGLVSERSARHGPQNSPNRERRNGQNIDWRELTPGAGIFNHANRCGFLDPKLLCKKEIERINSTRHLIPAWQPLHGKTIGAGIVATIRGPWEMTHPYERIDEGGRRLAVGFPDRCSAGNPNITNHQIDKFFGACVAAGGNKQCPGTGRRLERIKIGSPASALIRNHRFGLPGKRHRDLRVRLRCSRKRNGDALLQDHVVRPAIGHFYGLIRTSRCGKHDNHGDAI
ncbi:MAG TPA: hypothetical protein VL357_13035 [Rariglobus sp.]|nr:hypothetical protein [Rariglobus sp.]